MLISSTSCGETLEKDIKKELQNLLLMEICLHKALTSYHLMGTKVCVNLQYHQTIYMLMVILRWHGI